MILDEAVEVLRNHEQWLNGRIVPKVDERDLSIAFKIVFERIGEIHLRDAYDVLKENARYSSPTCGGFVYLSQIEELLK